MACIHIYMDPLTTLQASVSVRPTCTSYCSCHLQMSSIFSVYPIRCDTIRCDAILNEDQVFEQHNVSHHINITKQHEHSHQHPTDVETMVVLGSNS